MNGHLYIYIENSCFMQRLQDVDISYVLQQAHNYMRINKNKKLEYACFDKLVDVDGEIHVISDNITEKVILYDTLASR